MKWWIPIATFLIVFGCTTSQEPERESPVVIRDFEEIKESGKLIALIDNSSTSYFLYKGNPMGFEYDLLRLFCKEHELQLEIHIVKNLDQILGLLSHGKGDIAAANLTITGERLEEVDFCSPVLLTKQVLVQRKEQKKDLVRDPLDLANKTVHVRRRSSFYDRLKHLSDETGVPFEIVTTNGGQTVEELCEAVSTGEIDYTVADQNVAKILPAYFTNLDVKMELSTRQLIGWAVPKEAPTLRDTLTNWVTEFRKTRKFKAIYAKYFHSKGSFKKRMSNELYTDLSGKISPYDDHIKKYAQQIGWDWRMLASLMYQESKFNPHARSMGGAFGIMQMMPATARQFRVDSVSGVEAQIYAGTRLLHVLNKRWEDKIPDPEERLKYVMASYNAGLGHILDAYRLAEKYGDDPTRWESISKYVLGKSKPEYYRDEVVKSGYCKCYITVKYVDEIMTRYEHYKNHTDLIAEN